MKKMMIIGAGIFQTKGIIQAKDMGCHVIAIDGNPDAFGKTFADEFYHIDVKDVDTIVALARKRQIDAVTSIASEASLEAMGKTVSELDIPGYGHELIRISHNKEKYYSILKNNQVTVPETLVLSEYIIPENNVPNWAVKKFVVKPSRGSGSRGVLILNHMASFDFNHYRKKYLEPGEQILIQEYIDGKELTVDGFVSDGKFRLYAVSQEINDKTKGHTFSSELIFPPTWFSDSIKDDIEAICNKIVDCLNITTGPMHMEFVYTPDGQFFLIDFSLRGGGFDVFTQIVKLTSGYDILENHLRAALGLPVSKSSPEKFSPVTLSFIYPEKSGMIHAISGRHLEGEHQDYYLKFLFEEKAPVTLPESGKHRLAYYICWGNDLDTVLYKRDWLRQNIHFEIK